MQSKISSLQSKSDKAIAIVLAAFSMFVVGYSATRAFLFQSVSADSDAVGSVIPHQSTLWSDLGQ